MAASLTDSRIVALARAACAQQRPLRLIFLRGYWRAPDLRRVAAATVQLGIEAEDIAPGEASDAQALMERRLAALLAEAPMLAEGVNSLAEHLGGRAPERTDRLQLLPRGRGDPPADS